LLLTSERRDLCLPLDELEIPIDARAKLEALGITTVEELRAYWYYENRELLTEYLGDSPLNLVAMKPTAGAMRGMAAKGPGGSVNVLATGPVPPPRPMPRGVRALTHSQIVDIDGLRKRLDAKEPIVFSVRTFRNWDFQVVQETGEIPMPLPGATPDGGHAIVLVGYELNPTAPGGGAFIFRNSWGKDWARLRGRHGGGYGTLFFDYVRDNALEAYG